MNTILTFILNCIFLVSAGSKNDMDLQGSTYRISNGDVSIFDGREVRNGTLIISEGDYLLRVKKNGASCLRIGDSTELIIDGTLRLAPNDFKQYDMIRIVGKHVKIHGKGCLIGDKFTHTGNEGEWGMGINFRGATDATLSELTIKDCWGDCVYVGKKSGKVIIEDCHLDNGRRQGISVTDADSVIIRNCNISNVSGTFPQYGIDIEPNRNCSVNYALIENVDVTDCEGGIRALVPKAGKGNAFIGTVEIFNCRVSAKSRYPIHLCACTTGKVEGCTIDATNERPSIYANYVENLTICNNTLNVDTQLYASIKNKVKKLVGKSSYSTIRVVHASPDGVKDNKIVEK